MVVVRRSRWQTWTPPLCSTACLAIHLGSAAPDLPDGWSIVKHVAMILILLLDLILLPGEAVPRLLLHLETEPTVPPEVEVGCLCWTLGGKYCFQFVPYIFNQNACYRFGLLCQTFTFLAPFPMVWLCSAPISETILAFREYWKGAAAQGFVYQIGASGFFLKQLDRLGTLTPIVKPLTTKSSFGLTSSWGTGACFGSEDHELKWHHPWQTQTEWHLYLQKKMNFYETSTRNNIAVNNESIS